MKTRLLFINAIDTQKEVETRFPHLGIGYLVSSLRARFGEESVEAIIVDDDVERWIGEYSPDIVGISSVSQNYARASAYADIAKKHGLPVICGGVHITMLPSSLSGNMDIGVVGEGEKTICELVGIFRETGGFPVAEIKKVKGVVYREDGKIMETGTREPISPLDLLPLPARDLLQIKKSTFLFTSRGCPYRCAFCASSRFWSNIRFFSAEYVVREISELIEKYGVEHINFQDDLFSADVQRVRDIVALLRARNILGRVKFSCAIRANLVNDEVIDLLKELGVETIGLGLESGCDKTLKYLKGGVSVADNYRAVLTIKRHGISVFGSFIIGAPQEDRADILKTLDFIKNSGLDDFGVYVLTPFPGTPVWDYAESRGLVGPGMDWRLLDVDFGRSHEYAVILSEMLDRGEIYRLWKRFARYRSLRRWKDIARRVIRDPLRVPGYLLSRLFGGKDARSH